MPTMVGLGYSTKIPASQHTLANHMRWMNTVLTTLDLTEAVYVGRTGEGRWEWAHFPPGVLRGAVGNTDSRRPGGYGSESRACIS